MLRHRLWVLLWVLPLFLLMVGVTFILLVVKVGTTIADTIAEETGYFIKVMGDAWVGKRNIFSDKFPTI